MNFIWERQVGESSNNYKFFCTYRDMPYTDGIERTLEKSAHKHKKILRYFEKLSGENNWVKRAQAYDDYLEKIAREKFQDELLSMRKRHATIAKDMISKAVQALNVLDPTLLKPSDVTNMIKAAVEIERLSRGEATEINRVEGDINSLVKLYLPDNKRDTNDS